MKNTTLNVRGLCSRFRMHEVWRIVLSEQWDVLCVVEPKYHRNARLINYSKSYTLCYVGDVHGDYSGIVMFIRDVVPLGDALLKDRVSVVRWNWNIMDIDFFHARWQGWFSGVSI